MGRVTVWEDEEAMEMDAGNGCTTWTQMSPVPLNYHLKMVKTTESYPPRNSLCHVYFTIINFF